MNDGIDFLEQQQQKTKRNKEDQRKDSEIAEKFKSDLAEQSKEMEEKNYTIAKKSTRRKYK